MPENRDFGDYALSAALKEASRDAAIKLEDTKATKVYLDGVFSGWYLTTEEPVGIKPTEVFHAPTIDLPGEQVYYLVCENISGEESSIEDKKMLQS